MVVTAFKTLPVKQQLILMLCGTSFFCLFVASVAFILYDRFAYTKGMTHEVTLTARLMASHIAEAVQADDVGRVHDMINRLGLDSSIESACVRSSASRLTVMYSRQRVQPREMAGKPIPGVECRVEENFITTMSSGYLDVIQPILLQNSTKVGELHLRVSLRELSQRFRAFSVVMLLIVLLASMIAVALSSRLQAFISQPILDLANTAYTITRFKDYSLRATSDREDELGQLVHAFNSMLDTIELQNRALLHANEHLEDEVTRRTDELRATNRELEAFTYSVSHDLRSPLRSVDGFSAALVEDFGDRLDDTGKDYIHRIRSASQRMGNLIDSLLSLSRVSRQEMQYLSVDLAEIANEIVDGLRATFPAQPVRFDCPDTLVATGDPDLLRIVLENLIGNAWKYSAKTSQPVVSVSSYDRNGDTVYAVRDNGAGFDMKYVDKLFGPFQRLHHDKEFEGLGIGLATVARIVHRHGGEIWAEGQVGQGAAFYFTLTGDRV